MQDCCGQALLAHIAYADQGSCSGEWMALSNVQHYTSLVLLRSSPCDVEAAGIRPRQSDWRNALQFSSALKRVTAPYAQRTSGGANGWRTLSATCGSW